MTEVSKSDLLTVKKAGEKTLRIHPHALAQHIELGWTHVENEVVTEQKTQDSKTLSVKK
jgi:hypothetical protein